jgi:hypothetical protein
VSDFEALYSHKHDEHAQLYAFDVLGMQVRIFADCLSACVRPDWLGCCGDALTAFSSPPLSRARSALTYSVPLAAWAWREWSASTVIAAIVVVAARTGSR